MKTIFLIIILTAALFTSFSLTILLPKPENNLEPQPKPFGIHDFTPEKYPWVNETDV